MRLIAFITAPSTVRQRLEYLGESTRPPRCAPARAPPLWEVVAAPPADHDPHWEPAAQPLPQIDFDQRVAWCTTTVASGCLPLCLRRNLRPVLGVAATKAWRSAPVHEASTAFSRVRDDGNARWQCTVDTGAAPADT